MNTVSLKTHAILALILTFGWIVTELFAVFSLPLPSILFRSAGSLATLIVAINLQLYWRTGTLHRSRMGKLTGIPMGILLVAWLFRTMHWPWAQELFSIALLTTIIGYAIHFVQKDVRKTTDILRLLLVVVGGALAILGFLRWIPPIQAWWAIMGLCAITTLEFLLNHHPVDDPTIESEEVSNATSKDEHPDLFE